MEKKDNSPAQKLNWESQDLIFENVAAILILVNKEGRVVRMNKPGIEMIEKNHSEIIGLLGGQVFNCVNAWSDNKVVCGNALPCSDCVIRNNVMSTFNNRKNNYKVEGQFQILHNAENIKLHLLVSTSLLLIENEEFVLLTIDDVSDLKKTEQKLKENEQKYKLLAENISDVIWILNLSQQKFTYISPSVIHLTGFTPEEALLQTIDDSLTPESANHVKSKYPETVKYFLENPKVKKFYTDELQQICKDGSVIWIECSTQFQLSQNGEIEVLGVSRNIEKRKQAELSHKESEDKFSTAFKKAPYAKLISSTENGEIIEVNEKLCQYSGYTEAELLGKTPSEINVWADLNERNYVISKITQGMSVKDYEVKFLRKDGTSGNTLFSAEIVKINNQNYMLSSIVDISDRKKVEQELKESEKALKLSQQIAGLGSYQLNIKTGYWTSSEILDTILGIKPSYDKSIEGWVKTIDPEWRCLLIDYLQKKVIEKKQKFDKQYKSIKVDDKTELWVHALGELTFDENGDPDFLTGTIQDITQRKNAEELLSQKSEQLKSLSNELELILDALPGLVFYKDTNNRYLRVNTYVCEAHKMTKEQLEGKSLFDIYPKEMAQAYFDDDLQVIKSGKPKLNIDEPWETSAGMRWVSTSKIPYLGNEGNVIGIIGISIDITERKIAEQELKESEKELKISQQIAELGSYQLNIKTGFWTSSEILDNILGITPTYDRTIANWLQIVHPEWRELMTDYFLKEVVQKKTKFDKEYKIFKIDNKTDAWVHGMGELTFDEDGNPSFMSGTIQDITERKNIELALLELNKTKDKLISTIGHDLRSPLVPIVGLSKLLIQDCDENDKEAILESATTIYNSATQTFNLLESLLKWAKALQNSLPFNQVKINLSQTINECTLFLENNIQSKQINLDCKVAEAIYIMADNEMFKTIIRNLLSNAIKFTPILGSISISAELEQEWVTISVSDTGIGMSEHTKTSLFEMEKTVSKPGTEGEKGSGFGLLLCKEFVSKHGGKIWVESKEGKGSNFKFTMPLWNE